MLSDSDIGDTPGKTKGGRRRSRTIGTPRLTGRVSPLGAELEREFPTTKVGKQAGGESMGGGDSERLYGNYHNHSIHSGRCSGSHNISSTASQQLPRTPVITGDLVQSRDFHYTVEPVYRRPREVVSFHRTEPLTEYTYLEHKSSPYHTGTLRTSVRGLAEDGSRVPREDRARLEDRGHLDDRTSRVVEDVLRTGRLDQNYMMVRAQSRLQDNSRIHALQDNPRLQALQDNPRLQQLQQDSSRIQVLQENQRLQSLQENSRLQGLQENSRLQGLQENSRLQGLQENSRLQGLQENSRLQGLQENSRLQGLQENSRLQGLQENSRLQGLQENSRLQAIQDNSRLQALQDGYDRISHRSESRNDLLDSEHPVYDLYYHPGQYSGFVRTCDGKFVRTSLPQHQLENLETPYRNNPSAIHTIRRTPKTRHQTHGSEYCCPARDLSGGLRPSDQLQQSYATLRGRKWSEKNCRGVGDNYGRQNTPFTTDDARSVHSLADEFLLPVGGGGGRSHHAKSLSRSTDKSLDSLGREDSSGDQLLGLTGMASISTMLKREPPDGKEKPEPPKQQKHETLSRKNSKSDLIERLQGGKGDLVEGAESPHVPHSKAEKRESGLLKEQGGTAGYLETMKVGQQPFLDATSAEDGDHIQDRLKDWKVPASPRCPSVPSVSLMSAQHAQISASLACTSSPKTLGTLGPPSLASSTGSSALARGRQPSITSQMAARSLNSCQYTEPCTSLSPLCQEQHQPSKPILVKTYFTRKILRFFGVDSCHEEQSKQIWTERRKRLAVKKLGGVKEEEYLSGFGVENSSYSGYTDVYGHVQPTSLTSELEGDKMVLKISKPPRDKDSVLSLSWQCCAWMVSSLKRVVEPHPLKAEHMMSRSYLPSAAGQAAFYQAETCGGLAVCQPLTRISNHHHYQGESPAEEVFFSKPSSHHIEPVTNILQKPFTHDPYRTCSWQLPKVESELPRMSSDVGVSRIWNRMLDAAFDNSNRRKHGMGLVGKVLRKRRLMRHGPEPSRKRKLGGNCGDHRPFFTYWVSFVQVTVLFISLLLYGVGPIGVDLYKRSSMVLVTSLSLESVGYLEPANFWIGPSALDLIHLGAKYGPCMRWDEQIDRQIRNDRIKERDTACCLREDQAGCVQTQKSECKAATSGGGVAAIPAVAKHKWRLAVGVNNPWDYKSWDAHHDKWSQYPDHHRSSGPVCGLDPAFCEAPASIAPYIWPDDITKWPICRKRKEHADAQPPEAEHMVCEVIGHPCCIGIRGQCQITTREFCAFVKGNFHEEAALCSQVSCMDDVCGLIPFHHRDVPDQFYRTWTSLFLHAGIFHLCITLIFQYWLMRDLEKLVGAPRLCLLYLGSGMIGNLASAIFVPNRAEVGPSGSLFGVLACCIVEVIHQWPSLKYPEMAILKLVGVTAVFFLCGLLPWIDNYAHMFGFIFGFLVSYAIMPFVTFGVYERRRKIVLLWLCVVFAVLIFVGLILLFYVSPIQDCEVCKYFNCIPITKDFCSEQNINLKTDTG